MELREKQRRESLKMALSMNNKYRRIMADYSQKQGDIPALSEDDAAEEVEDESVQVLDDNAVRQLFEKNAYKLFGKNQIGAQDFMFLIAENDYPRFNATFPQIYDQIGGVRLLNPRVAADMSNALMKREAPKAPMMNIQPLPSQTNTPHKTPQKQPQKLYPSFAGPETEFILPGNKIKCLFYDCRKAVSFENSASGRQRHASNKNHTIGLFNYLNGVSDLMPPPHEWAKKSYAESLSSPLKFTKGKTR